MLPSRSNKKEPETAQMYAPFRVHIPFFIIGLAEGVYLFAAGVPQ